MRSINLDPKDFDGIVLVFFLDCFRRAELEELLPLWLATVKSGGFVYFVDFIMPEAGWRAVRGRFMLSLMHFFFRWQTGLENRRLVDFTGALQDIAAGVYGRTRLQSRIDSLCHLSSVLTILRFLSR